MGWLWSARGPGSLHALRAWQVCQLGTLRPAPCRPRSDSAAASAPRVGAAPTPPPTHCKMLQHRPGKETPTRSPFRRAPSTRLPCPLPGLLLSLAPADCLFLCLPLWAPGFISALYCPASLSPFFSTLPDPNGRGRSSGRWRKVMGSFSRVGAPGHPRQDCSWEPDGCVCCHPLSRSHTASAPRNVRTRTHTHTPFHLWVLPLLCWKYK